MIDFGSDRFWHNHSNTFLLISAFFAQDNFAVQSFERGIAAQESGSFDWEITPVEVSGGRGRPSTIIDKDEGLGKVEFIKLL